MTRKNKLIVLVAYLLLLTVFMLAYRSNRARKVKLLRADLTKISVEQDKNRAAEAEIAKISRFIPPEANSPAFIEALYQAARDSGLKQHEVSTEANKNSGAARPGGAESTTIAKHRFKISASGSYRNFAEYVRRLQNTERFNRIIDFKLAPDASQLKGTLTVELYSLPVKR